MYLYHNTENDVVINLEQIQIRKAITRKIKNRFSTYGYHEIHTPTFENYDLYANMSGMVNQTEMIKTIDNTGKVLVMRPDITIPITEKIAYHNKVIHTDLRYSYVQNVYRQTVDAGETKESTQAGVEYFGNKTAEADAEIIALAIHLLQDVQAENIKIELGHAAFFKQLATEIDLVPDDLDKLKTFIQAKNITEIELFLNELNVDPSLQTIVTALPFLYGKPTDVFTAAKALPLSADLQAALVNLEEIYDVLASYDVTKHIIIDLSLINQMDYYSDMIFQGFIEHVGKPILMGGRYDRLADQFGADIAAIGFGCNIDLLLAAIRENIPANVQPMEVTIFYDKQAEKASLKLASLLRNQQFNVVTYQRSINDRTASSFQIHMEADNYRLQANGEQIPFQTNDQVLTLLQQFKEGE